MLRLGRGTNWFNKSRRGNTQGQGFAERRQDYYCKEIIRHQKTIFYELMWKYAWKKDSTKMFNAPSSHENKLSFHLNIDLINISMVT